VRGGVLSHELAENNYGLRVDAIHSQKKECANRYVVELPKDQTDQLLAQSYKSIVETALRSMGVEIADTPSQQSCVIKLSYKQSEKDELVSNVDFVSVKSYSFGASIGSAVASGSSTDAFGNVIANSVGAGTSSANGWTSSTSQVPVVTQKQVLSYSRTLELKAFDSSSKQAWSVTVQAKGTSGDRRRTFSAMTYGFLPFITQDTKGEVVFPVSDNDPALMSFVTGKPIKLNGPFAKQAKGKLIDFCEKEFKTTYKRDTRMVLAPLGLAVKLRLHEVVDELLECGHHPSDNGNSYNPLYAAENQDRAMFEKLLNVKTRYNKDVSAKLRRLAD